MLAVVASVLVGLAGIAGSRLAVDRLARRDGLDEHAFWALGLAGVVPAWLVVWVALLPSTPGLRPQALAGVAWMLSAGIALLGAITSARRLGSQDSETPRRAWARGLLAIVPAWVIAALGRLVNDVSG